MEKILNYFPHLNADTLDRFLAFETEFHSWNRKINLVSRKDAVYLEERHILHSLSLALYYRFPEGSRILDIGTGGGFPGLPLAILFPEASFSLVDSVGKKIRAVRSMADSLSLTNVETLAVRAETLKKKYDYIVSRAVMGFPEFVRQFGSLLRPGKGLEPESGIFYLRGGEMKMELGRYYSKSVIHSLSECFKEEFFESKKLIFLPKSFF